jgi:hypothetical protein
MDVDDEVYATESSTVPWGWNRCLALPPGSFVEDSMDVDNPSEAQQDPAFGPHSLTPPSSIPSPIPVPSVLRPTVALRRQGASVWPRLSAPGPIVSPQQPSIAQSTSTAQRRPSALDLTNLTFEDLENGLANVPEEQMRPRPLSSSSSTESASVPPAGAATLVPPTVRPSRLTSTHMVVSAPKPGGIHSILGSLRGGNVATASATRCVVYCEHWPTQVLTLTFSSATPSPTVIPRTSTLLDRSIDSLIAECQPSAVSRDGAPAKETTSQWVQEGKSWVLKKIAT